MNEQIKILEKNAKEAKRANSFFDYEEGTATKEYQNFVANAEKVTNSAIKKLKEFNAPQERIISVQNLLKKYKDRKILWLISLHGIRASVPSVMITGAGNFPVAKKEKQMQREQKMYDSDPEYLLDKIKSIGNSSHIIKSDEANAIERIKAKIESLENSPDSRGGSAEIRRLRVRLLRLAPEEFEDEMINYTVNGKKATYSNIVALWNDGKIEKSTIYDDVHYYTLPLVFYNGKRHYRDMVNIKIDENGECLIRYNLEKEEEEHIPLTDELKYSLIIERIGGTGDKAIMYQLLKTLSPAYQKAKQEIQNGENEKVVINGENAEVIRNNENMRLQLIFDGKPSTETRKILKSNGFRWAPSYSAWQRLLNDNAEYALSQINKEEN